MAALQRVAQSSVSATASSYGSCKGGGGVCSPPAAIEMAIPNRFPAGLRVLVLDDDTTCLRILELILLRCLCQGLTQAQSSTSSMSPPKASTPQV